MLIVHSKLISVRNNLFEANELSGFIISRWTPFIYNNRCKLHELRIIISISATREGAAETVRVAMQLCWIFRNSSGMDTLQSTPNTQST